MLSIEEAHQIADQILDLRAEEKIALQKVTDAQAVRNRAVNILDGIRDSIKKLKDRLADEL